MTRTVGRVLGGLLAAWVVTAGTGCATDDVVEDTNDAETSLTNTESPKPPKAKCAPAKKFTARAWPAADALFHRDPRWLGGDAAYSVEISPGRILWLFGDSFIATSAKHLRTESKMVRNSLAIQTGADPTTSSIAFHWREEKAPSSFFPEDAANWFWPLHGARVGTELVLFLNELHKVTGGLGFESVATRMIRIANPDDEPSRWTWSSRTLPKDDRTHGVSVVVADGFLHALSTREGEFFFDVEDERWPLDRLDATSTFWGGKKFGPTTASVPIFKGGAPEFVTAAHCGEWLTVESTGFGATELAVRRAPTLAGPWSAPTTFYHPPESDRAKPFVYAGKFHPSLAGADLVATYAANSFDFAEVLRDTSIYYPRFVRITEER